MAKFDTTLLPENEKDRRVVLDLLDKINKVSDDIQAPTVENNEDILPNGNFEVDASGWTGSAGFSITRIVSTSEVLAGVGSGKISKDAANRSGATITTPFSVERKDFNSTIDLEFDFQAGTAYDGSAFGVVLYDVTAGIEIEGTIKTLPAGKGRFLSKFALGSNADYVLRFKVLTTTAAAMDYVIDNVSVGPDEAVVGAIIGEWTSYTPTVGNLGSGSYSSGAKWRRVGTDIEVIGSFTKDGTAGTGSSHVYVSLPNNYAPGIKYNVKGSIYQVQNPLEIGIPYVYAGVVAFRLTGNLLLGSNIAAGETYEYNFSLPISGWTSNTNLITDWTEYASNSDGADADTTTSGFAYGPEGSLVPAVVYSVGYTYRAKRTRFNRPIQPTDKLSIEFLYNGVWIPQESYAPFSTGSTYYCGARVLPVMAGVTDIDVLFYRAGVQYGNGWDILRNAGLKWRVRKVSNGNMAEAPASGIYESGSNANGYYVKYVDGTMEQWGTIAKAAAAGYTDITFPNAFADRPNINLTSLSYGLDYFNGYVWNDPNGWTKDFARVYYTASSQAHQYMWHAIGKWNLDRRVVPSGTVVGDSVVFVKGKRTSGMNIPAGGTTILYDEVEDAYNCYNPTTGVFTAPVAGLYLVTASILWSSIAHIVNSCKRLNIRKGSTYIKQERWENYAAGTCCVNSNVTTTVRLSAGDTISIFASYDQGATTTYGDVSSPYNELEITRIGA